MPMPINSASYDAEFGIEYCNQCPFFDYENGICSPNDEKLIFSDKEKIKVPDWCGNKKK